MGKEGIEKKNLSPEEKRIKDLKSQLTPPKIIGIFGVIFLLWILIASFTSDYSLGDYFSISLLIFAILVGVSLWKGYINNKIKDLEMQKQLKKK